MVFFGYRYFSGSGRCLFFRLSPGVVLEISVAGESFRALLQKDRMGSCFVSVVGQGEGKKRVFRVTCSNHCPRRKKRPEKTLHLIDPEKYRKKP